MQHLLMLIIIKIKEIAEKLGLIADYVVEEGTSGEWTYRKWASGIAECWVDTSGTWSSDGTVCGWYYRLATINLPSGLFIKVKACSASGTWGTGVSIITARGYNASSIRLSLISNQDGGNVWWNAHIIGRWK